MASLVDTNILVYACDPRDPAKRRRAEEIIERGARDGSLILPHQAVVEFVAATTLGKRGEAPLLGMQDALALADEFLQEFDVLYPTARVLRAALAGASLHRLPWYDAHLWAYAEANAIPEILSEDFQHGRLYGTVRVVNPFLEPVTPS